MLSSSPPRELGSWSTITHCIPHMSKRNRKGKSMSDTHSKMALLGMDVQVGIVTRYEQMGGFLTPISEAITTPGASPIRVFYVVVAFGRGYREMIPRNQDCSAIKQ